jgi:hypothetical protein
MDRNPATIPIEKANNSVSPEFIKPRPLRRKTRSRCLQVEVGICSNRWRKYSFQLSGNTSTRSARCTQGTSASLYLFSAYKRVISETGTRFGYLLDEQKRKELMIIYGEDPASTGLTAAELQLGGKAHDRWPMIDKGLIERAEKKVFLTEKARPTY